MIKYIKEESNIKAFIHNYTITHWNYINSIEIMLVTHVPVPTHLGHTNGSDHTTAGTVYKDRVT